MKKLVSLGALCLSLVAVNCAHASVVLRWNLTDPNTGTSASFVFNESVVDGNLNASNLVSITGNFGDGLFTYTFNTSSTTNCTNYDIGDLSLIRWSCGSSISSTNASSSGNLIYAHTWFDQSQFLLAQTVTNADWNGSAVSMSGVTDLNVANSNNVPEPSMLALLGLGLAGVGFSRRKKA